MTRVNNDDPESLPGRVISADMGVTSTDLAKRFEPAARVYGEPHEAPDGSIIITVARVRGRNATPVGAFVIRDGKTRWMPTIDVTRIALMGEYIGMASAVIATLAVLRRPPWPDLSNWRPRKH